MVWLRDHLRPVVPLSPAHGIAGAMGSMALSLFACCAEEKSSSCRCRSCECVFQHGEGSDMRTTGAVVSGPEPERSGLLPKSLPSYVTDTTSSAVKAKPFNSFPV